MREPGHCQGSDVRRAGHAAATPLAPEDAEKGGGESVQREKHAAGFNLDVKTVERWREMKVVVVQFDPNHRIIDAIEASPDRRALDSSSN